MIMLILINNINMYDPCKIDNCTLIWYKIIKNHQEINLYSPPALTIKHYIETYDWKRALILPLICNNKQCRKFWKESKVLHLIGLKLDYTYGSEGFFLFLLYTLLPQYYSNWQNIKRICYDTVFNRSIWNSIYPHKFRAILILNCKFWM